MANEMECNYLDGRRNVRHAELIKMRQSQHEERIGEIDDGGNIRNGGYFWADEISRSDDFIKMGLLTERRVEWGGAGGINTAPSCHDQPLPMLHANEALRQHDPGQSMSVNSRHNSHVSDT